MSWVALYLSLSSIPRPLSLPSFIPHPSKSHPLLLSHKPLLVNSFHPLDLWTTYISLGKCVTGIVATEWLRPRVHSIALMCTARQNIHPYCIDQPFLTLRKENVFIPWLVSDTQCLSLCRGGKPTSWNIYTTSISVTAPIWVINLLSS